MEWTESKLEKVMLESNVRKETLISSFCHSGLKQANACSPMC